MLRFQPLYGQCIMSFVYSLNKHLSAFVMSKASPSSIMVDTVVGSGKVTAHTSQSTNTVWPHGCGNKFTTTQI